MQDEVRLRPVTAVLPGGSRGNEEPELTASPREDTNPSVHRLIRDGLAYQIPDVDPSETNDWIESFDAMVDAGGQQRARYVMLRLLARARSGTSDCRR